MTAEVAPAVRPAFAVLIDAENIPRAEIADGLLAAVNALGRATVRRAYGDWTTPHLGRWKEMLQTHAIEPIQQFHNTRGKNASDSALIIDAMDLLHLGRLDGFCLVSSDGDFTRLAQRIRESGLTVLGVGERKSPRAFVAACDQFLWVEAWMPARPEVAAQEAKTVIEQAKAQAAPPAAMAAPPGQAAARPAPTVPSCLKPALRAARPAASPSPSAQPAPTPPPASPTTKSPSAAPVGLRPTRTQLRCDTGLLNALRSAVAGTTLDDGWASLGAVGGRLKVIKPGFESRAYGYAKLADLFEAVGLFEMARRNGLPIVRDPKRSAATVARQGS